MVDDDRTFSVLTQEYLEARGLDVTLVHNGDEGLSVFRKSDFDLCILDVKMPLKDGFTLAAELRAWRPGIPIIFLTGQTEKESRIKGFMIGADDYVTKPFSMEELYLRVAAVMRRVGIQEKTRQETGPYRVGTYEFDARTRELALSRQTVKMSAIEARLLQLFCDSESGMIEREAALRQIWDDEDMLRGRSLNVYVSKLRQYLRDDPNIEILNVHGIGYQLVVRKG